MSVNNASASAAASPRLSHHARHVENTFEFQKRRHLFIRTHNETLSVAAMCVCIVNESRIMDYAPSAAARIEAAAYGLYVRDIVDRSPSSFYIPSDILPDSVGASDRVRMLSVRAMFESKIIRFAFTQSSEVYVLRY
jgi:hypothetical protein